MEEDPEAQRAWLTFAVIGAGPTGVEMAGQIAELSRRSLKRNFRRIDPASAQVLLFDGGEEPLATVRRQALRDGHERDRTHGRPAADAQPRDRRQTRRDRRPGSRRRGTRRLPHEGLGGGRAGLAARQRCWPRRPAPGPTAPGTSKCSPTARLPGHPEVFVVGDMMALNGLPGVAEVAMQSGIHAARTIKRRLRGRRRRQSRSCTAISAAWRRSRASARSSASRASRSAASSAG